MTQLTAHFSLDELTFSDTAVRLGIDNSLPSDLFPNIQMLADGAERVRSVLGCPVRPNSGYRCEALEKIIARKDFIGWCARHGKPVGDASWSEYFPRKAHPKALSLDFTAREFGTPAQIVAALAEEKDFINFQQCIAEGSWVHISFPESGKGKGEVLTARFDSNGVASYTKGLK